MLDHRLLFLLPAWITGSCLAPAILPARAVPLEKALGLYPEGSEVVELRDESAATLRGIFIPCEGSDGDPAPVVLYLLDSSGSVAGMESDFTDAAAELRDIGFASLIVDYTGVGLSEGTRSVSNLFPDSDR